MNQHTDPFAEYLWALRLVHKAQRRGDAAQAAHWARVASTFLVARHWGSERDFQERQRREKEEAARAAAIRSKQEELARMKALNPGFFR